jgi:hypothetical protein
MQVIYDGDRATPLYLRLKAHYEDRLKTLRIQNDHIMDDAKRNFHVGKIAECKYFLELDVEKHPSGQ